MNKRKLSHRTDSRWISLEGLSPLRRRLIVFCVLALTAAFSLTSSFLLRFDFTVPIGERDHLLIGLLVFVPLKLLVFHLFLVHRGWWTLVGMADLARILVANTFASTITTVSMLVVVGPPFPRSVYVLDFLLNGLSISASRILIRLYRELPRSRMNSRERRSVLIYGAGWAGSGLLREIWSNPELGLRVAGFLDDSPAKYQESVLGVRIYGPGRKAAEVVERLRRRGVKIEEILIAMPSASGRQMRDVIAHCRSAGVPCRTLPGIGDLLTDKGLTKQIRDISVEDLLSREQVDLDERQIRDSLAGQAVLVTGAAGSIGSELSRQIATFRPRTLVLVDRAESDLFRVDLELRSKIPGLHVVAKVCDICDAESIGRILRTHEVQCVFHAAAYKHVPLMEGHPLEAVRNNVCGTWSLACAASANKVKRFVMISSDKAVNPTNIMGATKRISEMIVSSAMERLDAEGTCFVSVRFGNVLGSNGSVVPIFERQILAGGPVTVTHPEVQRYFMTIREAVQLVLQASIMGRGKEIFVLDMGEPVRVVDLARNMIRLAGLIPDEDIEIQFTGLRPGEKLFEELITDGEHIRPTHHEKIKIFHGPGVSPETTETWMRELFSLLAVRNEAGVVRHICKIVPEYRPSQHMEQLLATAEPAERPPVLSRHSRQAV